MYLPVHVCMEYVDITACLPPLIKTNEVILNFAAAAYPSTPSHRPGLTGRIDSQPASQPPPISSWVGKAVLVVVVFSPPPAGARRGWMDGHGGRAGGTEQVFRS